MMEPTYPQYRIRTIGPSDRPELVAASDSEYETLSRERLEGILKSVLDIRVVVELSSASAPGLRCPTLVADHFGNTLALSPVEGARLRRVDFQPDFAKKLVPLDTLVMTDGRYRSAYSMNLADFNLPPRQLVIDIYSEGRE